MRRVDVGVWVTVALFVAITVLSLASVLWRLTGHGPIFPLEDQGQRVVPATVAPAVTYQEVTVDG